MCLKRRVLIFLLILLPWQEDADADKQIVLVSSTAVSPYIIAESNSGIEIDIVKQAFHHRGYSVRFEHLPFPRALARLKDEAFDGALTISVTAPLGLENMFASKTHIIFTNVAITLKERQLSINSVRDLADKSIATFQYAREYLGEEFAAAVQKAPHYKEMPHSEQVVSMLFGRRVDVIVIEMNIFKYLRKCVRFSSLNTDAPVSIHKVFAANPLVVLFQSVHIRDVFNDGLDAIRANGQYQAIFDHYLK